MTLVNHGNRPREVELTSFAEICLNHRRADQAHPAFAKLFLETEFDAEKRRTLGAPAATWRERESGLGDSPLRIGHWGERTRSSTRRIACDFSGAVELPAIPPPWTPRARLSQTTGPVLDPVFSLRRRIRLEPGASARVAFVTGAADTREAAMGIAELFRDSEAIDRAFDAARIRCQDELREMSSDVG